MNYQSVYNQLIQKRKDHPATREEYGYVERHHIIPRSEGGTNDSSNLINLTAREHYVAHLLLTKIYDDAKMLYAYVMMSKCRSCSKNKDFKINSHLYESLKRLRNKMSCGDGNSMYGRHHSEETKEKMRQKALGKHHSLETRKKISESHKGKSCYWNKGRTVSAETRKKMSEARKGKHFSEEQKQKMSRSKRKYSVLQCTRDGKVIKEWTSVREAAEFFNITIAAIRQCCNGQSKSSIGCVWKYKDIDNK